MGSKKKTLFYVFAMVLMLFAFAGSTKYVYAGETDSVRVTAIDYENLTLTVEGSGDSVFYFSDKNQKTWERIEGTGNSATMDISWIPVSRDYVLSLKGNVSKQPVTVTLPKYNSAFKVKYDRAAGTISYPGSESYAGDIQWRVKGTTEWNTTSVSDDALKSKLDFYVNEIAAVTIYFRTAPQAGTSDSDPGARPSKEVTISLAKKTAAPAVTVDGSTFTAKVPAGVSYRLAGNADWTAIEGTQLDLTAAAANAFCSASNPDAADQMIEFRKDATAKAQVSASRFLKLNAQQSSEQAGLAGDKITTVYLSPKTLKVSVALDEEYKNNVYEYAVIKEDSEETVKWTALSVKDNAITKTFNSKELPEGATLQIRRKTSGKSGADDFKFASRAYEMEIGPYPGESEIEDKEYAITGVRGTSYTAAGILLSYTVNKDVAGDVDVAAVKLYKDEEEDTAAVTEMPAKHFEMKTPEGADTLPEGTHQVEIKGEGITSLLADTKLAVNTKYYFGLVLKNSEKILTKATLNVLPNTKITGTKEFEKIAGYEKEISFTLDYGTKDPDDYAVSLVCGNSNLLSSPDINIETKNGDEKNTQTIKLKILDSYFPEGAESAAVTVTLTNTKEPKYSEELKGIKVGLKQPIVSSTSGSKSFSEGSCSKDITLTLTLLEDAQVTDDFGITGLSVGTYALNGFEAEQEGTTVTVVIAQSALNKLKPVENHIAVEINGGTAKGGIVYKTKYKITVSQGDIDEGGDTADTSALKNGASFRLMSAGARAAGNSKILVKNIDYAKNEMTLSLNGNTQALYSINKKTWYSISDTKDGSDYVFHFGWAADTKDYPIYFKDVYAVSEEDYTQVTIPKKNTQVKVVFNKLSNGDAPALTVTNAQGTTLQWRKNAACEWKNAAVPADGQLSIGELESLRIKGGKFIARIAAANGSAADTPGTRYSKEVTVSVPKRGNASVVKINVSKLNLNTTTAMEYYNTANSSWTACTKNMSLWDIAEVKDNAAADASGSDVTILFRKAATKTAGYTKTYELTVPKQMSAPSISDAEGSDAVYSTQEKTVNKKPVTYHYLTFKDASRTKKYQYVIVPAGTEFNEASAKWVTVSRTTPVSLTRTKMVPGARIYVRILGTAATSKVPAQLSSAAAYYEITE